MKSHTQSKQIAKLTTRISLLTGWKEQAIKAQEFGLVSSIDNKIAYAQLQLEQVESRVKLR